VLICCPRMQRVKWGAAQQNKLIIYMSKILVGW
jgi:hypothetical protein